MSNLYNTIIFMTKEIELTQGKFAIVDDDDYEWLNKHKWCACKSRKTWIAKRGIGGRNNRTYELMHRAIMKPPKDVWIDHIDGNALNNTRENLRFCTRYQNQQNRPKNKNNASGYKGVYLHKQTRKWRARIYANGKNHSLGLFSTPEEAALAYDNAAKELHSEFANTNFP